MKKFRIVSVLMIALVLTPTFSTLVLAKEHQQIRMIVNPVFLELGVLNINNKRFASSAPAPATAVSTTPIMVSSYQEYKHVMVNAMRDRKEKIVLALSPNVDDKMIEKVRKELGMSKSKFS
jgi:lysophospholipid acyltransferase (LPLAT)-like uncharacterized protein